MKCFLVFCLFASAMGGLFANVGVFRGSGQTPQLGKSAEIQMVEEEVVMVPMRGDYPIDTSCRHLDPMKYHCTFKLRNLSDRKVTVPVGFPLSTEAVWFRKPSDIHQADVVGRFGFVAGTKDTVYPVRYVPYDRRRKFSNLFLWEMTFAPKQEITLTVNYTMGGYLGLASTRKPGIPIDHSCCHAYLDVLETAMGEGHWYVTATGGCWAGRIEKAVFKLYPFGFEEYLKRRGAWEESAARKEKRLRRLHSKPPKTVMLLTPESPMVRNWNPSRECWKEVPGGKRGVRHLELVYAPFEPKAGDRIALIYAFPGIPTRAEQFDYLLAAVKRQLDRQWARRETMLARGEKIRLKNPEQSEKIRKFWIGREPYSPKVEKNLADAILEFYGIKTGNSEIRDFLNAQCWYPVKLPPKIDPKLRLRLEQTSKGIPRK